MDNITSDFEAMRVAVENVKEGKIEGEKPAAAQQACSNSAENQNNDNYTFTAKAGNTIIYFSVVRKETYTFLWVGTSAGALTNLAVSMPTPYDRGGAPPATQILGSADHTHSSALASKLAKRNQRAYYVSYNLPDMDARLVQDADQKLFEEIAVHPEKF